MSASEQRATCFDGVTYGTSRMTTYPPSTETLYPSARSRDRSGLRLIGSCDIEDGSFLYFDSVVAGHAALGAMLVTTFAVGDGEFDVLAGRRLVEGEGNHLGDGQLAVLRYGTLATVDDDGDVFVVVRHCRSFQVAVVR